MKVRPGRTSTRLKSSQGAEQDIESDAGLSMHAKQCGREINGPQMGVDVGRRARCRGRLSGRELLIHEVPFNVDSAHIEARKLREDRGGHV